MAHRDYKLFMARIPGGQVPSQAGKVSIHRFDFAGSVPQLLSELEAGWEPVSHTFDILGGDVLITMLMYRDTSVPDDPRAVTEDARRPDGDDATGPTDEPPEVNEPPE